MPSISFKCFSLVSLFFRSLEELNNAFKDEYCYVVDFTVHKKFSRRDFLYVKAINKIRSKNSFLRYEKYENFAQETLLIVT